MAYANHAKYLGTKVNVRQRRKLYVRKTKLWKMLYRIERIII